jgi:hypothetical protein
MFVATGNYVRVIFPLVLAQAGIDEVFGTD